MTKIILGELESFPFVNWKCENFFCIIFLWVQLHLPMSCQRGFWKMKNIMGNMTHVSIAKCRYKGFQISASILCPCIHISVCLVVNVVIVTTLFSGCLYAAPGSFSQQVVKLVVNDRNIWLQKFDKNMNAWQRQYVNCWSWQQNWIFHSWSAQKILFSLMRFSWGNSFCLD